jgi:hypothetical protein
MVRKSVAMTIFYANWYLGTLRSKLTLWAESGLVLRLVGIYDEFFGNIRRALEMLTFGSTQLVQSPTGPALPSFPRTKCCAVHERQQKESRAAA